MALTQDRFLKVIRAAGAWKDAYERARAQIQALVLDHETKPQTAAVKEEFLQALWGVWVQNTPDMELILPLALETHYFSPPKQKSNNAARYKQQRIRERKRSGQPSSYQRPAPSLDDLMRAPTPEERSHIQREMAAELAAGAEPANEAKLAELTRPAGPKARAPQAPPPAELPPAELPPIAIEQTLRPITDIQPAAITDEDLGDFAL